MADDANGDGLVDVGDVIYLINYLYKGGTSPDPLWAGAVNCDGQVNLGDVVYLINYLFKAGPPPGC
ncbi:MAG: dockerin type I repeat-containing protein [Candidatus Zixiibacteriota bacterium]